jgi:glycosyltransferase involved in cell wall biosynthesis
MTDPSRKLRVAHFVTGGFSGATGVAINLCLAAQRSSSMQALLVLRKKRSTDMKRVQALRDQGLEVECVSAWFHWLTRRQLKAVFERWRPDVVVAHGFPEHILGRQAALAAGVPRMLHVEHNSKERYTPAKLSAAQALVPDTAALVGVSEGVRSYMLSQGFDPAKTTAIPNGIDLHRFEQADAMAFAQREAAVVMVARYGSQKDQLTLVRAMAALRDAHGLRAPLYLAGGGKALHRRRVEREVMQLGLQSQVRLMGHCADVPAFLMRQRVFVLSTHFEGMPLALIEAMAAGCACVGSDVIGVREVIEHERTGLLVPEGDPQALADALLRLLRDNRLAERLGQAARQQAIEHHGMDLMLRRYEALILGVGDPRSANAVPG